MDSKDLEQLFLSQWEKTVEKSRAVLEPHDLVQLQTLVSWDSVREALLDASNDDEVIEQASSDFILAKRSFGHISKFTSIFENHLGSGLDTAFFWGVMGILLQVVTAGCPDAIPTTLRMLRSIGYKTNTFAIYYEALPHMVNQVKEACFDIQQELVDFLVDSIQCIRQDGRPGYKAVVEDPIEEMEKRYLTMNSELEKTLAQVEKLVQFSLSPAIRTESKVVSVPAAKKPRFVLLPPTTTLRFFNRVEIFEQLDNSFGDNPGASFKSIALWGLGGIGKSSIALRYVETKLGKNEYDAMFWIHAEKDASIRQSFTAIAMKLKLPEARQQTHDENLDLVQEWLQSTDCTWLLVYDNVPSVKSLSRYWPVASRGHVLITTRNSSVAFRQASSAVEITSWDIPMGSEFLMFLLQRELGNDAKKEGMSALELSRRLSGHALGISHMAGLIDKRSWTISEFMNVYLNNPRRFDGKQGSELQALWDFSFQSLDTEVRCFLGVVSFLMPDNIPQSLFEITEGLPERLDFCSDQFSFSETIEDLLETSLIKRNRNTRAFSIHRMVQTQFRYFLEPSELRDSFEDAVKLVYHQYPKMGDKKGQLYDEWSQCDALLQHVISLKDCFRELHNSDKKFKAIWEFCDLLRECQRYLYESNAFQDLEDMCNVNLIAVETLDDREKFKEILPHIYSHQANMYEGLGQAEKAIELNKRAFEIRLQEQPVKQVLCYGLEANLGYTHNTAGNHELAMDWFEKARNRWLKYVAEVDDKDAYPPVLKKNTARCLLYLGKTNEARDLLEKSIEEFKNSKPFNWGMLAYAYQVTGLINRSEGYLEASEENFIDAQNVWRQGDKARLNPFYGGCAYKAGAVCLDQGKTKAAIKHLRDSLDVSKFYKEAMPVEHARTCFMLSEALFKDNPNDTDEAEDLRSDAEIYLKRRDPNAKDFTHESSYDKFIPIFWR
ncbi:tetratricopeptidelike helical [Fusarium sporotrichioides]|uniref:Tetratricopeptidelike helical n=1 Tax=Fusarium sporotrichioides TaxID=5514 RepID=A0A395S1V0_FUSSP|nr:tetratricopeptidelike helical [Fusarium sporotrichioides]